VVSVSKDRSQAKKGAGKGTSLEQEDPPEAEVACALLLEGQVWGGGIGEI
jgi:hypothetical protein